MEISPEKRLFRKARKSLSKFVLLIVTIITYLQSVDYLKDKIPASIEIVQSEYINNNYLTTFEFINKNKAIEKNDFVCPIQVILSDSIIKGIISDGDHQRFGLNFETKKNNILFDFKLLNKNEIFRFQTVSMHEESIQKVNFRIKDVDEINYYHFKQKPKPVYRILNFWLIALFLSIILSFDALLVILKDVKLGKMFSLARDFPLTLANKADFLEQYRKLYDEFSLRLKPPTSFFIDFKIKNLLNSFHKYDDKEIAFIKYMIHFYTEIYILYRLRTIFIIIGPLLIVISILALLLNYFYYELSFLQVFGLDNINKYALRILLVAFSIMILFPRQTMNVFFIKRSARKSGNFTSF